MRHLVFVNNKWIEYTQNHAFAYSISKNVINLLWIYVSEYICNDYDGYDTNIRYPGNTHMQVNSNRNA